MSDAPGGTWEERDRLAYKREINGDKGAIEEVDEYLDGRLKCLQPPSSLISPGTSI